MYQLECSKCGSLILNKGVADFVQNVSFNVPLMFQKSEKKANNTDFEFEEVSFWWSVDDMFSFENIGFTHSYNGQKYLACADCEVGPVGLVDQKRYLVAITRVSYKHGAHILKNQI